MERFILNRIINDLNRKMVFIVGPRQVGKTWLAKKIASIFQSYLYLNYDQIKHRQIIKNQNWSDDYTLIIFDEIHKMSDWKNYLKGLYDTKPETMKILVTGSARLEIYKHIGDSLAGRFYQHRLLPFSLSEIKNTTFKNKLDRLMHRGGFPEPFLLEEEPDADRWRNQYLDGLLREDILSIERITDFKAINLIFERKSAHLFQAVLLPEMSGYHRQL